MNNFSVYDGSECSKCGLAIRVPEPDGASVYRCPCGGAVVGPISGGTFHAKNIKIVIGPKPPNLAT